MSITWKVSTALNSSCNLVSFHNDSTRHYASRRCRVIATTSRMPLFVHLSQNLHLAVSLQPARRRQIRREESALSTTVALVLKLAASGSTGASLKISPPLYWAAGVDNPGLASHALSDPDRSVPRR